MSKIKKTSFFNKFNNIVSTEYDYDLLLNYLEFKQYPVHVETDEQKKRFDTRYKYFSIIKKRNQPDKIMFNYQNLSLEVISPARVEEVIDKEYYDDDDHGIGKGIVAFYKMIQTKYIGITRDEVDAYLSSNAEYNMNTLRKHKINKPILARQKNELWCLDLIDMGRELGEINYNKRYIMTVVDVFTRYTYIELLKAKTATACSTALQKIVKRARDKPRSILTDNGTEFKAEFNEYLEANDILKRETRTYTPQANGICERANKEIRKIIRAIMIRYNTNVFTPYIKTIEKIKNNNYHTTIKTTPATVDGYDPDIDDEYLKETYDNIINASKRKMKKYNETEFQVGDDVICEMTVQFSDVRRKLKAGLKKEIIVMYDPLIYTIEKIIYPKSSMERKRYELRVKDTNTFLRTKTERTRVYGSDLKASYINDNFNITTDEALNLNGCVRLETDLKIF